MTADVSRISSRRTESVPKLDPVCVCTLSGSTKTTELRAKDG
jgi:hypothetical protein